MKAKYDDIEIELTDRYMKALHELTAAFLEMMRKQDSEHKKCWAWGRCEVKDLASVKSLEFVIDNRIIEIIDGDDSIGFIYEDEEGFWYEPKIDYLSADGLEEIADKLSILDGALE